MNQFANRATAPDTAAYSSERHPDRFAVRQVKTRVSPPCPCRSDRHGWNFSSQYNRTARQRGTHKSQDRNPSYFRRGNGKCRTTKFSNASVDQCDKDCSTYRELLNRSVCTWNEKFGIYSSNQERRLIGLSVLNVVECRSRACNTMDTWGESWRSSDRAPGASWSPSQARVASLGSSEPPQVEAIGCGRRRWSRKKICAGWHGRSSAVKGLVAVRGVA